MRYLYHEEASNVSVRIEGDTYRYLFKVRRHRIGDELILRNLKDDYAYLYKIDFIGKKEARLVLLSSRKERISPLRKLRLLWCVIDLKRIEKMLPVLNEIGVEAVTFVRCERSQNNLRPDFPRLEKIILSSSQQCGRSVPLEISFSSSLKEALEHSPDAYALHLCATGTVGEKRNEIVSIAIGPEGGFDKSEIALFDPDRIVRLDTPMVLRSESAACAVAARLLL